MWGREEGRAKQGTPTQRPEREQGDSDEGQTIGRQGGALKWGSWGAFEGPKEGDPKGSWRSQGIGGTPKEEKSGGNEV